jgi:hypothetical protein
MAETVAVTGTDGRPTGRYDAASGGLAGSDCALDRSGASASPPTASLLEVQLPRREASTVVPRIVTLTVDGNDVLSAYGDTRRRCR